MASKDTYQDKSLEELKALHAKYKKLFPIFAGMMIAPLAFVVWTAFNAKNFALLGTCAVVLTLMPLYAAIKSIEKEIKKRESSL